MAEMDMKEKLVEIFCSVLGVEPDFSNAEAMEFVEGLIAHGVTVQEWIPVTERLPETELVRYRDEAEPSGYGEYYASEVVLVFATNHKIYLAEYCESNESNWWDSDAGLYEDVTHWMPLPDIDINQ